MSRGNRMTPALFSRLLASFVCAAALCGCSGAGRKTEIVGFLLEFKGDAEGKSAVLKRETRDFQQAKAAVRRFAGRVTPMDETAARRIFGEPASVFKRGASTVWGYKPASSSWFAGEKVFLTFDEKGMLVSAEYQQ